jgi:tRNA(Ile2) C34 agmatinyltransferase TiaS
MKEYSCPKCGSNDVFMEPKGNATGLYCGDCGRWIKWLPKNEILLVKRYLEKGIYASATKE